MTEVTEGVYRLGSSFHNYYILTEGGKATVIDAGCSKEWPIISAALTSNGLTPANVEAVIVTHAHPDHIGSARDAQNHGCTIKVHEDEVTRALGTYRGKAAVSVTDLPFYRLATWQFLAAALRRGGMSQPPLEAVETFTDGEALDLPGSPTVIHTPGHTEGHCAFHIPERRILFTGDALVTRDVVGPRTARPQMLKGPFHNNADLAYSSLKRLAAVDADLILPGHGEPLVMAPAAAVAAIR